GRGAGGRPPGGRGVFFKIGAFPIGRAPVDPYNEALPRKEREGRAGLALWVVGPGRCSRFSCVTRRDFDVARIAGVNIPTNKRVVIALQYIHGIGPAKAREIVSKVGIEDARRVNQLTDQEVLQLREAIDRDHTVEGDLRGEKAGNIN